LSHTFKNGPRLFHGLDIALAAGDRLCLKGANGSGKTTLLKIFSGLVIPSAGEVNYCNLPIFKLPLKMKSQISFMPAAKSGMFANLSGIENINFFASLVGLGHAQLDEKLKSWCEFDLFQKSLKTPFYLCSTGMKSCLLLFKSMLSNPRVLILDEPLTNLDANVTDFFKQAIKKGNDDMLVIYSSHQQDLIFDGEEQLLTLAEASSANSH